MPTTGVICPTDKATLAASLNQLCTGTNAYSKAQQALKACEGPEESIGSLPIYGTCGLKFSTTFCGQQVSPFVNIPTNFVNPSPVPGQGTGGANGVQFQVTSTVIQNVIFTAIITDANGNPVTVKCLGVPTVSPGSVSFVQANETVTITVTFPFGKCPSTGTYYFKLCATTDNNCINCVMGVINVTNDLFLLGAIIEQGITTTGIRYGSFDDVSGPWTCTGGGFVCPYPCVFTCNIFPDTQIYDFVITTNIHSGNKINITATGDCPGGASCYYGPNPPANCGLSAIYYFLSTGSGTYTFELPGSHTNLTYSLVLQGAQIPGFLDTNHDIASYLISMALKVEDCSGKHSAAMTIITTVEWWHCYQSP